MNDRTNDANEMDDGPILGREQAPDHALGFWSQLENNMASPTETAELPTVGRTAPLPSTQQRTQTNSRRMWPLAAAAALLAIVGISFLALRGGGSPSTTAEVVAGTSNDDAQSTALDGPEDENGDNNNTSTGEGGADGENEAESTAETANSASGDAADRAADETDTGTSGAVAGPTPATAPELPEFDAALGAIGDPTFVPLDQGLPENATFLANWRQLGVTWYAVADPATTCASPGHSEIRYVNGSGITQPARDPQLRFSGTISHFTIRNEQKLASWVVSCGTQLELYVAELGLTGEIATVDLVWFGEGTVSNALVTWVADEVSLSAIEPDGKLFAVDYNLASDAVTRNGGLNRLQLEPGAPPERSTTPLAATPDTGMTYWAGEAPAGTVSACPELYGSGQSDTLWLRQGPNQWQLAVVDDVPLASVTAVAIEPELSQIAFADVCDGETGRVFVGTQRADGRISNLREVDLAPYVPGFASQLFWADTQTLRIETDNSDYGFGTVRFDFRFDDGQNNGIIIQLDS